MWGFRVGVPAVSSVTGTRPSALRRVQQVSNAITADQFSSHRHVRMPCLGVNPEFTSKNWFIEIRYDVFFRALVYLVPVVHFSIVGVLPRSCSVQVIHFIRRYSLGYGITCSGLHHHTFDPTRAIARVFVPLPNSVIFR